MKCQARYYPSWSSRGFRGVDCNKAAKLTVPELSPREHLCGIHAGRARRDGMIVLDGIWLQT